MIAKIVGVALVIASVLPARAETVDPNKILFSIPTISDDLPAIEPLPNAPSATDVVLNEDDWSQFEFFPRNRLPEIKRILTELKSFELSNRADQGWRNIYIRKIERRPVVQGPDALARLEAVLAMTRGPAPLIDSSGSVGRVKNGFTFAMGQFPVLYGYTTDQGVAVLGGLMHASGDDARLGIAFLKLKDQELILVDWRAQVVLVSIGPDGKIEKWKP